MTPRFAYHPFIAAALLLAAMNAAPANPLNGQVVGGAATVQGQGTATVTIQQSTDRAIINWQTFNIGAGETTQFVQPSTSSITLNRVIGGMGASALDGTLTANGRVFIVNPDGLLFGKNSVINTGGFLATTNDIKNDDFMAGRHNFNLPGRPDASIVNQGSITAASGGFAALVAPGVRNTGSIIATLGQVTMASGNVFTLDLYGDKLITLAPGDAIAAQVKDVATGLPLTALVKNEGQIKANGGRVELTAAAARQVVDAVINNSGVIEANSIGTKNGMIVLGAATQATKPAGAPAQNVRVSGKLLTSGKNAGEKGGTVAITGESIAVAGATIDVAGQAGGGTALIGGDVAGGRGDAAIAALNPKAALQPYAVANASTVSVDAASTIDASAKQTGDGGKVVVWSNGATNFAGLIVARGGDLSGNGGFAEVSGKRLLAYDGVTDLRALKGIPGTLLLDPADFYIVADNAAEGSDPNVMTRTQVQDLLLTTNLIIKTEGDTGPEGPYGDIHVHTDVTWSGNTTLTLSAHRDILFSSGSVISNTGSGNLVLRADSQGTGADNLGIGAGTIIFGPHPVEGFTGVDFSGGTGSVSIFYNPSTSDGPQYDNPKNFSPNVRMPEAFALVNASSFNERFHAYMLINNVNDLQDMRANLAGLYALGRNIDDASATATWNGGQGFIPIGDMSHQFVGVLDGLGQKISNLFIAPNNSLIQTIGLFGVIGENGVVANLTLKDAAVVANANSSPEFEFAQFVGVLAGSNGGTISNVSVSGTINGNPGNPVPAGLPNGIIVGGLVGQNGIILSNFNNQPDTLIPGTIKNASAAVNVTVGDASDGNSMNNVGGLAGSNVAKSTIDGSSASGSVAAGANSSVGGLVGTNGYNGFGIATQTGTITNSTATGHVTLTSFKALDEETPYDSTAGGLVGNIGPDSFVQNSTASGKVTANLDVATSAQLPLWFLTNDGLVNITLGGLAGENSGTITNSQASGLVSTNGALQGDAFVLAGGLVGANDFLGVIVGSTASGNVSLDPSGYGVGGGLVGANLGSIGNSSATGAVSGGTNSVFGGLAGANLGPGVDGIVTVLEEGETPLGTIQNSFATGTVTGGNFAVVGGLVGMNALGSITWLDSQNPTANGAVTGGNNAWAGGLVGWNMGSLSGVNATGSVTGGNGALVGGLVGYNVGGFEPEEPTSILNSFARGPVSGGNGSFVGGLVGVNVLGSLSQTAASGAVTGGDGSVVGGLLGSNLGGSVSQSYAIGTTNGGADSIVAGLIAFNAGTVNQTYANGLVTGDTAGGLIAIAAAPQQNAFAASVADIPPSNIQASTVTASFFTTDGTGQTQSAGGTATTIAQLASALPSGFTAPFDNNNNTTLPVLAGFPTSVPPPPGPPPPPLDPTLPVIGDPLLPANFNGFAPPPAPSTDPVVTVTTNDPPATPPSGNAANNAPPPGQGLGRTPNEQRFSGVPPLNENRFIPNEVVVQILSEIPRVRVIEIARTLSLTIIASETLGGRTVYRFQTGDGQSIRDVILAWERNQIVASAQPNYTFGLAQQQQQQPDLSDADTTSALPGSDPELPPSRALGQYVIGKFKLDAVHKRARGDNVLVAVIDSAIDRNHPELRDVVTDSFVAGGGESKPHSHGTAMAGAIAARRQLMGVAPGVRILAIDAFSPSASGAQGTSFQILRGIDWAVARGARVINMSFAGPRDLMIERSLKTARDNGVILIAAAGNAGPKSPPLFPAADPNVIAVTATDSDDKVFAGANRGTHLAVAAPGVDILALGPEGSYQLTTGTSVAAAHVTGIAALLLHRNPSISPDDVRKVLTTSARNLGKAKNDQTGSGLVDPERALDALERTPLSDKSASAAQPRQR